MQRMLQFDSMVKYYKNCFNSHLTYFLSVCAILVGTPYFFLWCISPVDSGSQAVKVYSYNALTADHWKHLGWSHVDPIGDDLATSGNQKYSC